MELHGFAATTLAEIAALAGALVVAAYVLKLKRRPVPVVFVRLWTSLLKDKEATSLFSRLKRVLSLLVQLILLAALVLALGDPRKSGGRTRGRHLVLLLDASASMQATDGRPTRLEQAKRKARTIVRGLGGSDQAIVVQVDGLVTPLSTMTDEVSSLLAAVDKVHATDSPARLEPALQFAMDALRGLSHPEIVLLSDGRFLDLERVTKRVRLEGIRLSYERVGHAKANVAITTFAVRRYPLDKSRYEVMLELANTGDEPVDVELSIYGDGVLVDMTRLHLKAQEKLPRFYPNLSGASRLLEARIRVVKGPQDVFPVDDHAWALLPERRRARVLCVTRGNTYLEAALLLDEYLQVTTVDPGAYPLTGQQFDVTIFDDVAPEVAAGSGAIFYLHPKGEHAPFEVTGTIDDVGFDTWDRKSPLLRWTAVGDVNIAQALRVKLKKGDHVVGSSFDGPLMVEGKRDGHRFVALTFDVRDSDLPLRISWPLLVLNVINYFTGEDTSYVSSYRTGTVWRIAVPQGTRSASLVVPGGGREPVPVIDGNAVFFGQKAGVYTLRVGKGDAATGTSFAANLRSVQESTIEPVQHLRVGSSEAGRVSEFRVGVRRRLWIYLLLFVVALSTLEWITYHRRVTV